MGGAVSVEEHPQERRYIVPSGEQDLRSTFNVQTGDPFEESGLDQQIQDMASLRGSVRQLKSVYLPVTETSQLAAHLQVLSPELKERMKYYEESITRIEIPNNPDGFFARDIPQSLLSEPHVSNSETFRQLPTSAVALPQANQAAIRIFATLCGVTPQQINNVLIESTFPSYFANSSNTENDFQININIGLESAHLEKCRVISEQIGAPLTLAVSEFEDGAALGDKLVGLTIPPEHFLPKNE